MSTIVIIEDNAQNARMAAKLLRHAGHKVLTAEDGEMGLMTVFENQPDLVLIDLGLPDIDGQTVIALIRQQETLQSTPLIAFTAWPEGTAHSMAQAYGCDGVITKPIDTRAFADQVMAYIKQGPVEAPVSDVAASSTIPSEEPQVKVADNTIETEGDTPPAPSADETPPQQVHTESSATSTPNGTGKTSV